jgi:hypothetical protein
MTRCTHGVWTILAALSAAALAGCDTWKQADATLGLVTTFNVDTFERDGRQLIRMHSRDALVVVDPQGAKVLDYHRHLRTGWTYSPPADPKDELSNDERIAKLYNPQPNVLAAGPWQARTGGPGPKLDDDRHWMVDATTIQLTLLSDTIDGLRWRKTFTLYDNGLLDVAVQLQNMSFTAKTVSAESNLPDAPTAVAPAMEHRRVGEQWFSRRLISEASGTDGIPGGAASASTSAETPFAWHEVRLGPGDRLTWTERWWINAATGKLHDHPPDGPPEPPVLPWLRVGADQASKTSS